MQLNEVERWFVYANEDYTSAFSSYEKKTCFPRHIANLCSQSAEKYLKGILEYNDHEKIEKTHDLIRLLDSCIEYDKECEVLRKYCVFLDQYGSGIRYPSEIRITENDAKQALDNLDSFVNSAPIIKLYNEIESYRKIQTKST